MPSDNYRQTSPNMQTSPGDISKKELKHSRFMRENNMFPQSVNIKNHVRTHKCSESCLVVKQWYQKFDALIQLNLSFDDQYISASGDKFSILKYW